MSFWSLVVLVSYGVIVNAWKVMHVLFYFYKPKRFFLGPDSECTSGTETPLVSVILPAKDETGNIGACIRSVLASEYSQFELIVVNDRSTDSTAQEITEVVASNSRVRVIDVTELKPGWTGKMNAVREGLAAARGELLLIMDADTRHTPQTLGVAVATQQKRRATVLTLLPRFENRQLWSRIAQPLIGALLFLWKPLMFVNSDRRKNYSIAWGGFLLLKRSEFEALGGLDAVRDCFAADIAIARRAKQSGYRIRVYHAPELLSTHLYSSAAEMVDGWTRILRLAADNRATAPVLTVLMIVLFSLSAYAAILVGAISLVTSGPTWVTALGGMGAVHLLLQMLFLARLYRVSNSNPSYVVLHLPAMLATIYVLAKTAACTRQRRMTWRGTHYELTADGRAAA